MIYLIISILLNVLLFIAFRSYKSFGINTLQAIVVNYFVCAIIGLFFLTPVQFPHLLNYQAPYFPSLVFLGALFVSTFYLMARTTQIIGMSVASIAAKMSFVIPVIFALYIFDIEAKTFDGINFLGIGLGLTSIFMASYRNEGARENRKLLYFLLPIMLFLAAGLIDTTLNYINLRWVNDGNAAVVMVLLFFMAATFGAAWLYFKDEKFEARSLIGGLFLGVPNYFSIYFILKTLSAFQNDGSIVYPIFNIGTIIITVLVSILFFKEKTLLINKIGILIAMVAILLISYQELLPLIK